jgi:colanic acid/amylovoran biosynthesis glycosyltransferase
VRVAYVLKRYPCYSETFVVNEILAHEAAGLEIEIFALRPTLDTHFQDAIARVRAPVHHVSNEAVRTSRLWDELRAARDELPELGGALEEALDADVDDVRQAALVAQAARARRIDHLHAHFASVATAVARMAGRFADLPYTFTAHAHDVFSDAVDPTDLARKIRDAAGVVTVSEFNLAHLRARHPRDAAKIRRIYNGLPLDRLAWAAPRARVPRILGVGRLVEKKGFEHLIDACRILADRGRAFEARILGSGRLEEQLAERIRGQRLEGRVVLVGNRPNSEVVEELRAAAALAAPCVTASDGNRDGLPTTLLEAMALGTPCVSTDVTGIPEVLRNGETGLMVPQGDARALADALELLLDDPEERVRLARAARRRIEADFEVRRNAALLGEVFLDAQAGSAERARVAG